MDFVMAVSRVKGHVYNKWVCVASKSSTVRMINMCV